MFLRRPLGTSNQHLIEKIVVIQEQSNSSGDSDSVIENDSDSSIDMSEDTEQQLSDRFNNDHNGMTAI